MMVQLDGVYYVVREVALIPIAKTEDAVWILLLFTCTVKDSVLVPLGEH